ncbi:hypothetical protein LX64_00399 [Chitinophaga skermanii]|uniref:Uncharacterized protein n=1 Tax=Chitinophaga skermanii TaxID=331697 RepID=A0A327R4B7_9BACT|nr:hypothetical protein [Chitinophaga skermanii]RAJ10792.1 hypothetical protein LX64_00399 [Chitinophaga skermanii]
MRKSLQLTPQLLEQLALLQSLQTLLAAANKKPSTNWGAGTCAQRKEFGRAATTAAAVRHAFKETMEYINDKGMYRRLSSQLFKTLKQDTIHPLGERTVEAGNIAQLKGFEFNSQTKFRRLFTAPYHVALNRQQGHAQVTIPAFQAGSEVHAPKNSTHFKLIATIHAINFDTYSYNSTCVTSEYQSIYQSIPEQIFQLPFQPNDNRHLFVSIGIVFVDVENNRAYKVKGGTCNAMQITHVFDKAEWKPIPQTVKKIRPKVFTISNKTCTFAIPPYVAIGAPILRRHTVIHKQPRTRVRKQLARKE